MPHRSLGIPLNRLFPAPVMLALVILCASVALAGVLARAPLGAAGLSARDHRPADAPRELAMQGLPTHAPGGTVERRRAGSRATTDPPDNPSTALAAIDGEAQRLPRLSPVVTFKGLCAREPRRTSGSPRAPPVLIA